MSLSDTEGRSDWFSDFLKKRDVQPTEKRDVQQTEEKKITEKQLTTISEKARLIYGLKMSEITAPAPKNLNVSVGSLDLVKPTHIEMDDDLDFIRKSISPDVHNVVDQNADNNDSPESVWLNQGLENTKKKKLQMERDITLVPVYDLMTRDERTREFSPGEKYFEMAFETFNRIGKYSSMQARFFEKCINTLAPIIYGNDLSRNRIKLLKRFHQKRFKVSTLLMCPRQFGKSFIVAHTIATLLFVARKINIVIFSAGKQSSTSLIGKIKDAYCRIPGAKERILQNKSDFFKVSSPDEDLSKSRGNRQMDGNFSTVHALSSLVGGPFLFLFLLWGLLGGGAKRGSLVYFGLLNKLLNFATFILLRAELELPDAEELLLDTEELLLDTEELLLVAEELLLDTEELMATGGNWVNVICC